MAVSTAMAIMGGASALGGLLNASEARKAGSMQADAATQANERAQAQYEQQRADNEPFRQTGLEANNRLAELMKSGQFDRKFGANDLANDTVYNSGLQFGLDNGNQGIERQAAAGGSMLSGATLKALTRFGNDYGSTKAGDAYNRFNTDQTNQYNRYAGLSGAGQQATNVIGQAGQQNALNYGQNVMGAANARGASGIAASNALTNGLSQAYNGWQQNKMMDMMGGGGSGWGQFTGGGM